MTEAKWERSLDPEAMLQFLRDGGKDPGRGSRLFAAACCRHIWHLLVDERSHEAVEVAEQFAEEKAGKAELKAAKAAPNAGVRGKGTPEFLVRARKSALRAGHPTLKARAVAQSWTWAWEATRELTRVDAHEAARLTCRPACLAAGWAAIPEDTPFVEESKAMKAAEAAERSAQAALLRDIFGPLPFRQVRIDPAWLTWNGGAVRKLAEAAYEQRSLPDGTLESHRLAVLADALEEAGCTEPDVLGHCRQQEKQHVRGCWVVDLLLGRV
jgi:hypothetical protein